MRGTCIDVANRGLEVNVSSIGTALANACICDLVEAQSRVVYFFTVMAVECNSLAQSVACCWPESLFWLHQNRAQTPSAEGYPVDHRCPLLWLECLENTTEATNWRAPMQQGLRTHVLCVPLAVQTMADKECLCDNSVQDEFDTRSKGW